MNRPTQLTKWFFTWNNYPSNHQEILIRRFDHIARKYAFQQEKAPETGTTHIQGVLFLKRKMRWSQFGLPSEIHWEPIRGTDYQAIDYVLKQNTRIPLTTPVWKNITPPQHIEVILEHHMFQWQKQVINIVNQKPDDRIIYWYYEYQGRTGKSALVKHLCYYYKAITLSGRTQDIKNAIVRYKIAKGFYPNIVLFDIPRSAQDFIKYEGLEQVKNGCFLSTKYECEMVIMNSPHIMCFANFEPAHELLSHDRWDIREIALSAQEMEILETNGDKGAEGGNTSPSAPTFPNTSKQNTYKKKRIKSVKKLSPKTHQ